MGKKDARVDAYIAKSADFAKPVLSHLRQLIHDACPEVEETIKWGFPHFMYRGMLCNMAAFKQHCAFMFWHRQMRGAFTGMKKGEQAMGQLGRITSVGDLPSASEMKRQVKAAMELNEKGIKSPRPVKPRSAKKLTMPADFAAALGKNKKARSSFENFSPSRRNDYIEWVTEAKRAETRAERIATAVQWIAQGKSRNWKYETKRTG